MRNVISWLLGFFLVANIYLIPMLEKTPRATDLIGVWIILFNIIVLSLGAALTLTRSPAFVSLAVLIFVLLFNIIMKRTIKLAVCF